MTPFRSVISAEKNLSIASVDGAIKKQPPEKAKDRTMIEKPKVKLIGTDGNAAAIMGTCRRALIAAGQADRVPAFTAEAMTGDYSDVLQAAEKYCDVS